MRRPMACLGLLALVLGAVLGLGRTEHPGFSGFLGCRFSRSVCRQDEECIDDRLFGSCQKIGSRQDSYQYYLDRGTLQTLENEIQRLVPSGYTWSSLYTQCVLGNILLAFRRQQEPDPYWCDRGGDSYYNSDEMWPRLRDDNGLLDMEKKDELIRIHKYFVDDDGGSPYSQDIDPRSDLHFASPYIEDALSDEVALDNMIQARGDPSTAYDRLLSQLSPDDLDLLKQYLQDLDSEDSSEEEPDFKIYDDRDGSIVKGDDTSNRDYADKRGYIWDEDTDYPAENNGVAEEQREEDTDSSDVTLTPNDAKLLGDLLQEKISVNDLTDEETARLTDIVDRMNFGVELLPPDVASDEDKELGDVADDMVSETQVLKDAEIKRTNSFHAAVKKEQMNTDVLDSDVGHGRIRVELAGNNDKRQDQPITPAGDHDTKDSNFPKQPHDYHFEDDMSFPHTTSAPVMAVNEDYAYLQIKPANSDRTAVLQMLQELEDMMNLDQDALSQISIKDGEVSFHVNPNSRNVNGKDVADFANSHANELKNRTGITVSSAGIGDETRMPIKTPAENGPKYFVLTFVLCGCIAGIVLVVIALYLVRRHSLSREKLAQLATGDGTEASKDYQDLCRQRMQGKSSEKPEPLNAAQRVGSVSTSEVRSPSSRSSTSSWSEEPITTNMDISTGHIVLSYMEDHLKNKDRLDREWEALCAYEAEPNSTAVGMEPTNMRKNRYSDILPYDHSRVVLSNSTNVSGSDYINASTITDHDPRNPAYIATIGPLPHTVADFWQMIWEQGSVVIVMLTKLTENGVAMCHRYWPEEGSDLYHIYEVHLVSEHIWCDDYLVRSFYLKNLQTNETRTVTQFHFLTWSDLGVPSSPKPLLEFRRKVNKSYRGRSCPIVVHCSDGVGRSGTYILLDMVLNRMSKGAKEIDIAATLEHIRDQRVSMVKTKEQFEFALASVAEEVHAILKALPQ